MTHQVPLSQHLEKLPAFVMVARLGSITKAAKAMAITQAALSQSIRTLEDAIETPLFIRSKAGVKITEQGALLFRYAEQLGEDLKLLEARIRNPGGQRIERLRIGTHEALAIHIWPQIVESFQVENPDFFLSIVSGRVDELVRQVLESTLDIAVTVTPKPATGLAVTTLYQDKLNFYTAVDSSKVVAGIKLKKGPINKETLSKVPILTDSHAHLAQDRPVARVLTELGLHSAHYFQLNSFEASARLASKGLGIALLPSKIGDDTNTVRKINISGLPSRCFDHAVCCSYLEQNASKRGVKLLLKHLKERLTQRPVI